MSITMVRASSVTLVSTVEEGDEAVLHFATGDDVADKSGMFFNGMNETKAHPQACEEAARQRLRALSLELTGLAAG